MLLFNRLGTVLLLSAIAFAGCEDRRVFKYTIQGNSMEPVLKRGQTVMVVPYVKAPSVGDIVMVNNPDYGFPVAHRLEIIDGAMIQTKGDANKLYDRPLPKSAIIGQVFPIEQ